MKGLPRNVCILFFALAVGGVVLHGEGTSAMLGDSWFCAAGTHSEHGDGHYDNMLEGWHVEAPDGQHVEWGVGTDCNEVHTPAGVS